MLKKFATALGLLVVTAWPAFAAPDEASAVQLERVPNGGLQPQLVARDGVWHLVYFQGEPAEGNLFYVNTSDEGKSWSAPLRVNSQPGSAVAMGTIRGAQLAVGRDGWVHVAWNGSNRTLPKSKGSLPMLYSRLLKDGDAFEPQRNLMQTIVGLDGGGSIAADEEGHVFVAWHGVVNALDDETKRQIFITRSEDDGQTWSKPATAWEEATGACGCCQLRLMVSGNEVMILYRAAEEMVNRDTYLLSSRDGGHVFSGEKIHSWFLNACPMSSYAFGERGGQFLAAWESEQKIFWTPLKDGKATQIVPVGAGKNQKYPALATTANGETLIAWTEDTGWNRGGTLHWKTYDADDKPLLNGQQNGVPVWSFPAAVANKQGGTTILY